VPLAADDSGDVADPRELGNYARIELVDAADIAVRARTADLYASFLAAARALRPALTKEGISRSVRGTLDNDTTGLGDAALAALHEAAAPVELTAPAELVQGLVAQVLSLAQRLHRIALSNPESDRRVGEAATAFDQAVRELRDRLRADLAAMA
jgi:hypothetical protein